MTENSDQAVSEKALELYNEAFGKMSAAGAAINKAVELFYAFRGHNRGDGAARQELLQIAEDGEKRAKAARAALDGQTDTTDLRSAAQAARTILAGISTGADADRAQIIVSAGNAFLLLDLALDTAEG